MIHPMKAGDPIGQSARPGAESQKFMFLVLFATAAFLAGMLAWVGWEESVPGLIAGLKSRSPSRRCEAAEALGIKGDPRAVEPLIACLKDADSNVRQKAQLALDKFGWASLEALVQKAIAKVDECKEAGFKRPITRSPTVVAWDLTANALHRAHFELDDSMQWHIRSLEDLRGARPVTVILVGPMENEQVGRYSISSQPAFREWVRLYAVQFKDRVHDGGIAEGYNAVISLDPARGRLVSKHPEYGDTSNPIAGWIRSLPAQ